MEKIPMECRDYTGNHRDARINFAKKLLGEFIQFLSPPKEEDDSCRAWTNAVRRSFEDIIPEGLELVPQRDPQQRDRTKEYLVDFAWVEKDYPRRVLLACECEWASASYGRHTLWTLVEEDFEKLLAVKAPFKVLIFSSALKDSRADSLVDFGADFAKERLKASLTGYGHHLAGETYMFIDFPATGKKGGNSRYDSFAWIASEFGKAEIQKFESLGSAELKSRQPSGRAVERSC